jgi:hypothetical protein
VQISRLRFMGEGFQSSMEALQRSPQPLLRCTRSISRRSRLVGRPVCWAASASAGSVQAALLGQLFALGNALRCFLVQLLGHGCRAAHAAEPAHYDFPGNIALAQVDVVARADFTRGLGIGVVDRDPALPISSTARLRVL